jgi:hypothetical protein
MDGSNRVEERVAQLAPPADWSPDTAAAMRRHRVRRREEWRRGPGFWWKAAIAAGIVVAVAGAPPTRALAQRLWSLVTVGRVEVLQVDLDLLPKDSSLRAKQIRPPDKMLRAESADAARGQVGFLPRLPHAGVLRGEPRLSTLGPVSYEMVVKADDLRQLLAAAGVAGESVPAQWDGARVVVQSNGTVMAEWAESDVMLIQMPPLSMAVPEGFDLRRFTTLVLRGLKLPAAQSERMGEAMAAAPAWMLPLDAEDKVGIREVSLRTGTATLVYDYDTDHPDRIERLTLIWNRPDRIYMLSCGCSDAVAIAAANSME